MSAPHSPVGHEPPTIGNVDLAPLPATAESHSTSSPREPTSAHTDTDFDTMIDASLATRRRNYRGSVSTMFKRDRHRSNHARVESGDGARTNQGNVQGEDGSHMRLSTRLGPRRQTRQEQGTEREEVYDLEQVRLRAREEIKKMGGEIGLFVVKKQGGQRVRVDDDTYNDNNRPVATTIPPTSHATPPTPLATTAEPPSTSTLPTLPTSESVNLYAPNLDERKEALREVIRQANELIEEKEGEKMHDVLWENQRGIFLFGSAFFSANTLFPFDPPAWTVPAHVSSQRLVTKPTTAKAARDEDPTLHNTLEPDENNDADGTPIVQAGTRSAKPRPSHQHGYTHDRKPLHKRDRKRTIKPSMATPYDLHTFQLPSDHWRWLTPWMIHMREDGVTDERGWEYNYWFKSKGWGCEVGKIGWGAWVRRRKWVRYRILDFVAHMEGEGVLLDERGLREGQLQRDILQAGREHEGPIFEKDSDGTDTPSSTTRPKAEHDAEYKELGELRFGRPDEVVKNGHAILSVLGQLPTDRERLTQWQVWLEGSAGKAEFEMVKALFVDPIIADKLVKSMTYAVSRQQLQSLWTQHGLIPDL